MGIRFSALVSAVLLVFFAYSAVASGLDLNTDKEVYKLGDVVKIFGASANENVSISLLGISPLQAVATAYVSGGRFSYEYQTLPGDSGITLVRAESSDAVSEKRIFIQNNESDVLGVEFVTPANNEKFFKDSNLTIKARVTENSAPVSDASVRCVISMPWRGTSPIIELQPVGEFFIDSYYITEADVKAGGVYVNTYQIGRGDPTQFWVVKCVAEKDGLTGGVSRAIRVVNKPITLDILSPVKGALERGERIDIIVRAYYEDGSPAKNAILVIEDSDDRLSKMYNVSDSGVFEFRNYDTISKNDYIFLGITATDDVGNVGKNSALFQITKSSLQDVAYKMWWVVPMLMTIMLLTIYLERQMESSYISSVSKTKKAKQRLEELYDEKEVIQDAKSSLEENYYKRELDEETFKRMMEGYGRELIEIDIKIKRLKEELKSSQ
ncbi:MAG: hypothetical protein V1836_04255 [Candidatus Aenigmatarchaeota archaeon]